MIGKPPSRPPTVACKSGSPVGMRAHRVHAFCTFCARLACSVGAYRQKPSASELSRKSVKVVALVVGWAWQTPGKGASQNSALSLPVSPQSAGPRRSVSAASYPLNYQPQRSGARVSLSLSLSLSSLLRVCLWELINRSPIVVLPKRREKGCWRSGKEC